MNHLNVVADIGVGILLPLVIVGAGIYFTKYLDFFYLIRPARTVRLLFSKEQGGGVSPFRALSVSLAGTLGVGNIVGVAVALLMGGKGALFWMWISAFFSMILKYAEIVLALRYKVYRNGRNFGGPMYYMKKGIGGFPGRLMAVLFALLGVISAFSMGSLVQMKAASDAMYEVFSVPPLFVGLVCAGLCLFLLLGGYGKISRVTAVVIPLLSGVYLFMSARVVFLEWENIPMLVREIVKEAFSFSAASGGIFGFIFSDALRHGVAKGSFSHEAGCGTGALAHASADTRIPAKQGILGIFEVFFDTLVLCSLTGFVILFACGDAFPTDNGMALVIHAFASYYGDSAAYLIAISVVLFALATVVCWGYYGGEMLSYFSRSRVLSGIYIVLYALTAVCGAVMSEGTVWVLSDITVALMTVINLSAVFFLRKEIREETEAAGLCPPRMR